MSEIVISPISVTRSQSSAFRSRMGAGSQGGMQGCCGSKDMSTVYMVCRDGLERNIYIIYKTCGSPIYTYFNQEFVDI